jgi:RNA polymerase sigma factor (sigma-70 family)
MLNGTLSLGEARSLTGRPIRSVDSVEALARRVTDDWLHASSAYLNPREYEDLLSYIVAAAWVLHQRYDPTKGTQSFSTYAYRILWRRVPSWYRQRWGSTRYHDNPVFEELDADRDAPAPACDDDDAMFTRINVELLSPDARHVLERIAIPMVADDLSLEQLAVQFGYSRRWVSRALDRLRDELVDVIA